MSRGGVLDIYGNNTMSLLADETKQARASNRQT